jgi:magnesium and cobalt transporter
VSDPHPARASDREDKRTFLQKVAGFIHPAKPESTDDLIDILAKAEEDDLIAADSRVMLEGVLRMADMTATDAMVPVSRMDFLDIDAPFETLMHSVIQTAHSRFPVYSGERENIVGILLAKDLLKLQRAPELSLRTLLRPPIFVPESKGLNDLLRDFRANRSHMALVVDEFGNLAGCITIEDVLEEIVGEIEDEFDTPEEEGSIFGLADGSYRVSGDTPVERVAESFSAALAPSDPDEEPFDTIGGLIAHEMGHVPQRGESHVLGGLRFLVMHTRGGAVRWFKVSPAEPASADPDAA